MEEPRDVVLAGRDGAHGYAAPNRRQAARRDREGACRSGDSGAHAQRRRDRRQQQIAGGLQDLYRRRNGEVVQGHRRKRRARGLTAGDPKRRRAGARLHVGSRVRALTGVSIRFDARYYLPSQSEKGDRWEGQWNSGYSTSFKNPGTPAKQKPSRSPL